MQENDNGQWGSEREMIQAKLQLDEAVAEFTQAQSFGAEQRAVASQQLHTAVIRLWWKMRAHLEADGEAWHDLEEYDALDRDYVWSGAHPETNTAVEITGLSDLGDWLSKEVAVSRSTASPNTSQTNTIQTKTLRLPAGAALAAAKILSERFHEFGWGAERRHDTHEDEPKPEHLRGLLVQRDQQNALKQLPERFKQEPKDSGGQEVEQ